MLTPAHVLELAAPVHLIDTAKRTNSQYIEVCVAIHSIVGTDCNLKIDCQRDTHRRLLSVVLVVRVFAQGAAPVQLNVEFVVIAASAIHVDALRIIGVSCLWQINWVFLTANLDIALFFIISNSYTYNFF